MPWIMGRPEGLNEDERAWLERMKGGKPIPSDEPEAQRNEDRPPATVRRMIPKRGDK